MLYDYMNMLESIGLDLLFASIFFLIGMAIKDVLNQGNVPVFGRRIVWLVLFLAVPVLSQKVLFSLAGKAQGWVKSQHPCQQQTLLKV